GRVVCDWLPRRVDGLCACGHCCPIFFGAGGAADADARKRETLRGRRRVDPGRVLPVDAAKGGMPRPMPLAPSLRAATWRIPIQPDGLVPTWHFAWRLLRQLLLGLDGAALRRRRDERVVDCSDRDSGTAGKSGPGRARSRRRYGRSRDCRRRLDARELSEAKAKAKANRPICYRDTS